MTRSGKLDSLIHDMSSKCASLKTAVALLRSAPPEDVAELLPVMKRQACGIAEDIEAFEAEIKSR